MSKALTVAEIMAQSGVAFGTSGARGLVVAMTDRVCYSYTRGFLSYLKSIGEFAPGDEVAIAGDLRPSTPKIMAACARAIGDAGGRVVNCGHVPTPTMASFAMQRRIPSLMVTGSHIPDDRNGIKFYRPAGEVLKSDEAGMMSQSVEALDGDFAADGSLVVPQTLPDAIDVTAAYVARYVDWFGEDALRGLNVGVYQHSAVGRDVLVTILQGLGAEVTALGRSDRFIPVDTEAVRPEDQALAEQWAMEYRFDALASTDGDSDRPLLADETGKWLRGDVLAAICAMQTGCEHVVTPVSSNTLLERSGAFPSTARTRIGSPYVIAAMNAAVEAGHDGVCGYEANGGFLLATDIVAGTRRLEALPTRDAVLPIVTALVAAKASSVAAVVHKLPPRFTHSDRIQNFPTSQSQALLTPLTTGSDVQRASAAENLFGAIMGRPTGIDFTDGVRMTFADERIVHLRPSGNAPELRCYTEAESEEEARRINAACLDALFREVVA